jgi:hypothetical protein
MEELYNRLSMLKVLLNSNYGEVNLSTDAPSSVLNVYEESYKIRKKIHSVKMRKDKIKRIFNV